MYIVLDFSKVEEVSGSFTGFLAESLKIIKEMQKELVVVGANRNIREILAYSVLEYNIGMYENFMEFYTGISKTNPAILVIDDDDEVREVIGRALKKSGVEILGAAGGDEGLEMFKRQSSRVLLVVLDLQMPGLGGEETLVKLMEHEPEVKVLILSGMTDIKRVAKLKTLGTIHFLAKPFLLNQLKEAVNDLLSRVKPSKNI
jgi:CheY-like chemotaxis protein